MKKKTSKNRTLASFLRISRENAELSQLEVSKKLGYSSSQFVSNWERGLSAPPSKSILFLAKVYNIEAEVLYDFLLEFALKETEKSLRQAVFGKRRS